MTEGGQEMVCAILTSGILEKEVLVTVSSSDITANGMNSMLVQRCTTL